MHRQVPTWKVEASDIPDDIVQLLTACIAREGSDIHVRADKARIRVRGVLVDAGCPTATIETMKLFVVKTAGSRAGEFFAESSALERVDWAFSFRERRFRGHIDWTEKGPKMVLRLLPAVVPSMSELGIPQRMQDVIASLPSSGLIVVGGATGAGKSTSLAAFVDYFNSHASVEILTLEDPIEFVHQEKSAMIDQRELGKQFSSYRLAIECAMRSNPNVILYGEMKDVESIEGPLSASETGHLVMATVHASSSAKVTSRLVDGVGDSRRSQVQTQLVGSLRAILCQKLVPKKDGGLIAVFEVCINTPAISTQIRTGAFDKIRSTMENEGMPTIDSELVSLAQRSIIEATTALRFANDPTEILAKLRALKLIEPKPSR